MATSLREELASLKIDRSEKERGGRSRPGPSGPRRRRGVGWIRILSWMLWLIPLGILGVAGGVAYRQYDQIRSRPEVTVGLVQKMTTGEAEKLLSAKGYLISRYRAMIGTKLAGRVEKMLVEEGKKVKKGDTLAVIEHNDLKAMLASREAQLLKTQAELEEAQAEAWEKDREERRSTRLNNQKMATLEEAEKAQAAKKKADARVAALEASLKLCQAGINEMKATIETMHLYAPFDGTVVEKQGEEGEIISPMAMSSSLGRSSVVTIANLGKMDVETDVSENLLSRIDIGQPAEVSVSAVPDKRYHGRLRQILPYGDRTRGTVKVKVEILDPDDKLFPELAATVHFLPNKSSHQADANKAHLFVPKLAVFQENGHDQVWVLGPKDRISKRQVEVAMTTDALARVEEGLSTGDTVILNPPKTLRDGETVRVAQ